MPANVVVGTSLFQILFVTAATTMVHSVQSKTVDIVLASLLLVGGVVGAQLGARMAKTRSEEHTSELQSLMRISYAVFCLQKKSDPTLINTLYSPCKTTPPNYETHTH